MAHKKRSSKARRPVEPRTTNAELPATEFWRRVLMIGALLAIAAGVAETVTGGLGIYDRFSAMFYSPMPTPVLFPNELSNELLIVVSEFERAEGIPDSRVHHKIADQIRNTLHSLNISNVRVETALGAIPSSANEEAEQLGVKYGATSVIWGEETSVDVRVNMLNLRKLVRSVKVNSGEEGLVVSSYLSYMRPNDIDGTLETGTFTNTGMEIDPWLPLIESPLEIPPKDVSIVKTDGTYVTTNTDPDSYVKLITTDLPRDIEFFALLPIAQVQLLDGNEQLALDLLEKALTARTDEGLQADDIGEVFRQTGRLHVSISLDIERNAKDGWWELSLAHGKAAIYRLQQALDAGLDEPLTHYFLGLAYTRTHDFSSAIQQFDKAMELGADSHLQVFVLHDRSMAKMDNNDDPGALQDIATLLEMDPLALGAYINRSQILLRAKDYTGVMADLARIEELRPTALENLSGLLSIKGQAEMGLEQYDSAIATFERLLSLAEPDYRFWAEEWLKEARSHN